jgi:hypothetical protein
MQVTTLNDAQELADFLEQSKILDTTDHQTGRMYVVEFDGQDVLVFPHSNGAAFVVYPPESLDAESGGSIHDHARAIAEHAA